MEKLSKAKLKLFTSLAAKKYRYRHRMFLAEGKKMFEEAVHSGWPMEAVILQESQAEGLLASFSVLPSLPLCVATDADFRQLAQLVSPEGILTVVGFPSSDFGEWTPDHLPPGPGFMLDSVQDPGNLGTIMRIADWFGFSSLICSKGTVDFLNEKTLRSSMGAVFRVPVTYVESLEDCIGRLAARVWMADMEGEALQEVVMGASDFLLLGNEANGVTASLGALSGVRRIHIPGSGGAESLNVSVAAGILAWELARHGRS